MDPLAEKYNSFSPYNYVLNNPISLVDPDGMGPEDGNDYVVKVSNQTINIETQNINGNDQTVTVLKYNVTTTSNPTITENGMPNPFENTTTTTETTKVCIDGNGNVVSTEYSTASITVSPDGNVVSEIPSTIQSGTLEGNTLTLANGNTIAINDDFSKTIATAQNYTKEYQQSYAYAVAEINKSQVNAPFGILGIISKLASVTGLATNSIIDVKDMVKSPIPVGNATKELYIGGNKWSTVNAY
jgi:hypothetical protein